MSSLACNSISDTKKFKKIPLSNIENTDEIPVGRAENLIDRKFGRLTVLYRVKNQGKKVMWKCRCDCGNVVEVRAGSLTSGHTASCGCLNREYCFNMNKSNCKDITDEKFGHLVALEPTNKRLGSSVIWKCKCDCGNIVEVSVGNLANGSTISCGCLKTVDITNKRFGSLVALEPTNKRSDRHVVWKCKCDCGNIVEVSTKHLTSGNTTSCGCARRADIINEKFGRLVVLGPTDKRSGNHVIWKCQCDCGNIVEVSTGNLTKGHTTSCGCLRSKGQEKISKLLNVNNLIYQTEKVFNNLQFSNNKYSKARFDFYVNNQYLIEYDGIQHYEYSGSGWSTEEQLIKTQEHDRIKNQYCIDNHIPLIRIPYTKLDTLCIEDLMLETTTFRVEGT